MRARVVYIEAILKHCLGHGMDKPVLDGACTARELATLCAEQLTSCPACYAEAFVNIDCRVCAVCDALVRGDTP